MVVMLIVGGGLPKAITGVVVCGAYTTTFLYWDCWRWVVGGHDWSSGVLPQRQDMCLSWSVGCGKTMAITEVVVCCSRTVTFNKMDSGK